MQNADTSTLDEATFAIRRGAFGEGLALAPAKIIETAALFESGCRGAAALEGLFADGRTRSFANIGDAAGQSGDLENLVLVGGGMRLTFTSGDVKVSTSRTTSSSSPAESLRAERQLCAIADDIAGTIAFASGWIRPTSFTFSKTGWDDSPYRADRVPGMYPTLFLTEEQFGLLDERHLPNFEGEVQRHDGFWKMSAADFWNRSVDQRDHCYQLIAPIRHERNNRAYIGQQVRSAGLSRIEQLLPIEGPPPRKLRGQLPAVPSWHPDQRCWHRQETLDERNARLTPPAFLTDELIERALSS